MSNLLPIGDNLVDWPAIRALLKQGTLIDIQVSEVEPPLPYIVLMTLDAPVFFCRLAEDANLPEYEPAESQVVFIPTARDFCSLRVFIKGWSEQGGYIALAPAANAEFLRQRRSVRIKASEDINYRVQFEGKSSIYKGVSVEDIGRGGIGLLVYAASSIPEGVQATVKISIPRANGQVLATGVVSYCIEHGNAPRMYRIGIKFTKISPRDQQTIAMYIDQARKLEKHKPGI